MSNAIAALALCGGATTDCCAVETEKAACPLTMPHAGERAQEGQRPQATAPFDRDSAPPCSFCIGCPERLPASPLMRIGSEHQIASAAIPCRTLTLLPHRHASDPPLIVPNRHSPRYILHHSLLI